MHLLKTIRNQLGLSQKSLGVKIGLKQSHLSACERNERELSLRALRRLLTLASQNDIKKYNKLNILDLLNALSVGDSK